MVSPISEGQELYCEFTKQARQEKIMYMYSQMFCFKYAENTTCRTFKHKFSSYMPSFCVNIIKRYMKLTYVSLPRMFAFNMDA